MKNLKRRFKLLKNSAKQRKISVDLNLFTYKECLIYGCAYCGKDLNNETGYSLDRVDNSKGYNILNVAGCCKVCNKMKGSLSIKEFFQKMEEIYNHQLREQEKYKNFNPTKKELMKEYNIMMNCSKSRNAEKIKLKGKR